MRCCISALLRDSTIAAPEFGAAQALGKDADVEPRRESPGEPDWPEHAYVCDIFAPRAVVGR
jgi:hypothetical protein